MSASLGHQYQDVLENAGIPSEKARELAHTVAELTQKHFLAVAADFEANGFPVVPSLFDSSATHSSPANRLQHPRIIP